MHPGLPHPLLQFNNLLLVRAGFASFYVAEHVLQTSGVLAVVTIGILYSRFSFYQEDAFRHSNEEVWHCIAWLSTTVIFLVTGALNEQHSPRHVAASHATAIIGLSLVPAIGTIARAR